MSSVFSGQIKAASCEQLLNWLPDTERFGAESVRDEVKAEILKRHEALAEAVQKFMAYGGDLLHAEAECYFCNAQWDDEIGCFAYTDADGDTIIGHQEDCALTLGKAALRAEGGEEMR